jgi:hypothetical protein
MFFGLVIFSLFQCLVLSSAQGDYDRFRFIDSVAIQGGKITNYLFRGNEPVLNGKMDYNWLVGGIKQAAKNASLKDFPDKFYVVDFNLLSIEVKTWETEKDFFDKNTQLGIHKFTTLDLKQYYSLFDQIIV